MKKAFTFIELIFVMVVIAILATYSIPRFKQDTRTEAIKHILTTIRYTHFLALHDKKHLRFDSRWQKSFWSFRVYHCADNSGLYYMIGSDKDLNRALNRAETAVDPSNGKYTFWENDKPCPKNSNDALNQEVSPNIFLTQKFGINSVTFNNCDIYTSDRTKNDSKHIAFDSFGRPHKGFIGNSNNNGAVIPNHWGYAIGNCSITFGFKDSSIAPFTIVIENETGYAHLQ